MILVLLFSRLNQSFRPIHVVGGQFLGIGALVLISLSGQLGRSLLPESWIGMLGLIPISLGLSQLQEAMTTTQTVASAEADPSDQDSAERGLGLAGLLSVASITMANGSDNIGVYLPMFASDRRDELVITLVIFALLTALWCLLGWWLTRWPLLADLLQRQGEGWLPAMLLVLGGFVLYHCHTLQEPALAVITLTALVLLAASRYHQFQAHLRQRTIAGCQ